MLNVLYFGWYDYGKSIRKLVVRCQSNTFSVKDQIRAKHCKMVCVLNLKREVDLRDCTVKTHFILRSKHWT